MGPRWSFGKMLCFPMIWKYCLIWTLERYQRCLNKQHIPKKNMFQYGFEGISHEILQILEVSHGLDDQKAPFFEGKPFLFAKLCIWCLWHGFCSFCETTWCCQHDGKSRNRFLKKRTFLKRANIFTEQFTDLREKHKARGKNTFKELEVDKEFHISRVSKNQVQQAQTIFLGVSWKKTHQETKTAENHDFP